MRNKVKELRIKSGKSLDKIAKNVGVCCETVRMYEVNKNALLKTNVVNAIKYARELGVGLDELLKLCNTIKERGVNYE